MVTHPPLHSCKLELDTSPTAFGELRPSADYLDKPEILNQRLDEDGYLLIPGFFNRDLILEARTSVAQRLAAEGALNPKYPATDLIAASDKAMTYRGDLALNNPAVERVVYGP